MDVEPHIGSQRNETSNPICPVTNIRAPILPYRLVMLTAQPTHQLSVPISDYLQNMHFCDQFSFY